MTIPRVGELIWEQLWKERVRLEAAPDESGQPRGATENILWISELANVLEEFDLQDVPELKQRLKEYECWRFG